MTTEENYNMGMETYYNAGRVLDEGLFRDKEGFGLGNSQLTMPTKDTPPTTQEGFVRMYVKQMREAIANLGDLQNTEDAHDLVDAFLEDYGISK